MTGSASGDECLFCAITAGRSESSFVYADDTVVAFMDRFPVTPGHLLVVPRDHAVGLEDLPAEAGERVWTVGRELARALRRSGFGVEGINLMVCDGAAAMQSVFHFHLHVVPRFPGDGWVSLVDQPPEADRSTLEAQARAIRDALAATR